MNKKWYRRRKRLLEILEVGNDLDHVSRAYDFFSAFTIVLNLTVSIMYTYENLRAQFGTALLWIERITVAFFALDYVLRLFTARVLYEDKKDITEAKAIRKYIFSFMGIVDLLSFLPYYLPIFFPSGTAAFRMIRIVRIFRLFRINAYYDSLHVITEVISGKRSQLISSVVIILILMIGSSLCMYSLEHEAQPDVFANAFSGMWWSVSTLLTVGYGDIYPITPLGKIFGIIITFLGVGMVAIPTGIISAGFVEQYSRIKRLSEYARQDAINFIKVHLTPTDHWAGKQIREIGLPEGIIVAAIQRGHRFLVPRGNVTLSADDVLVLGAESIEDDTHIDLQELVLKEQNPWVGQSIRELDISRQTVIVLVERNKKTLIPKGDLVLQADDKLILYTQTRLTEASLIQI